MPQTRKNRGTDYARLTLMHPPGADTRTLPFEELSTLRQLFVILRARGYSVLRACELAEVPIGTAQRWNKQPWCAAAIKDRQQHIVDDKVAALTQVLPAALGALAGALRGENTAERLDAAKFVVDHLYGKATSRSESHTRSEVALVSPDDILAALDRVNGATSIEAQFASVPADSVE